jgi:hypothetical protein
LSDSQLAAVIQQHILTERQLLYDVIVEFAVQQICDSEDPMRDEH